MADLISFHIEKGNLEDPSESPSWSRRPHFQGTVRIVGGGGSNIDKERLEEAACEREERHWIYWIPIHVPSTGDALFGVGRGMS